MSNLPLKLNRTELENVQYVPGSWQPVIKSMYRYELCVGMHQAGRQKTEFKNGDGSYFEFVKVLGGSGLGGHMVPVFKHRDGLPRFLMVLEERGPLLLYNAMHAYDNHYVRPRAFERADGNQIELWELGSLEFPGGGFNRGETIKAGKVREALEEIGLEKACVNLTWSRVPVFPFGSDFAAANFYGIMELPEGNYEKFVENDGGLQIYAFTEKEIDHNIAVGALSSGQAVITAWNFYKMLNDPRRSDAVDEARRRGLIIEERNISVQK